MNNDIERNSVVFHDRAIASFFSLYRDFKHSVASINRQWDENVFQQLQNKYVSQLRHQLQSIVSEMLDKMEPGMSRVKLNYTLSHFIEHYIKEFIQKIQSL